MAWSGLRISRFGPASMLLARTTPSGTLADWERAHPSQAEALAIQTAAYLARPSGVHLYIVLLSSAEGLDVVRRAKRDGARLTAETTSAYLGLSSDDPNGFLLKMVPPIRSAANGAALWDGLLDGTIELVGTDNTSRNRTTKQPEKGLHGARPGYACLRRAREPRNRRRSAARAAGGRSPPTRHRAGAP